MDIKELKAHAFDCLATIEAWQRELRVTNEKINELTAKEEAEKVADKEKKGNGK